MAFVFYDTETTGLQTSFDQILQFAAIKTDSELNEIGRFEIRCRLLPNVVPSPMAMFVTGVKAEHLSDLGRPSHYQMICSIRTQLLAWSPAFFIGYNSIEFDEHLLRHSFYKALCPPYLTNTNGNCRSDVMRMVQAAHLFHPGEIVIPKGKNGKASFKLDLLAPANGFKHENAHDALADVEATIFLCRLLAEKVPDIWSAFMRFGHKASAMAFLEAETVFCFSDFYFGKPFTSFSTGLGQSPTESSRFYIYDLSAPPEDLIALDDGKLASRLGASPKVVRGIRCNACPILMTADEAPEALVARGLDADELDRRAAFIRDRPEFIDRLIRMMESSKKEDSIATHVEQQLYSGFFSESDQQLLLRFHELPWEERPGLVEQLSDDRLRYLGFHLINFERPDVLDVEHCKELDSFHAMRSLNQEDKLPWLTLHKAEAELVGLIASAQDESKSFYEEHLLFLRERIVKAKMIIS